MARCRRHSIRSAKVYSSRNLLSSRPTTSVERASNIAVAAREIREPERLTNRRPASTPSRRGCTKASAAAALDGDEIVLLQDDVRLAVDLHRLAVSRQRNAAGLAGL